MLQKYEGILKIIDGKILSTNVKEIPQLFKEIPLPQFGELSLQEQNRYPNIKNYFPPMASEEIQKNWTGSHGRQLLTQSVAFVKTVVDFYKARKGVEDLSKLNILDFGCGWGRLIRLLYKYIPETQIYGVDAWEMSLQTCRDYRVRANFAKIDDHCKTIPFDSKFDIIYAFSVFTHLSIRASEVALDSIRNSIKDDGILILTIRQFDYWQMHAENWNKSVSVSALVQQHINEGFAFAPHNREPIDGDITFGDTSISIEYIQNNWKSWKIIDYKINLEDPYQSIVFLQPV